MTAKGSNFDKMKGLSEAEKEDLSYDNVDCMFRLHPRFGVIPKDAPTGQFAPPGVLAVSFNSANSGVAPWSHYEDQKYLARVRSHIQSHI